MKKRLVLILLLLVTAHNSFAAEFLENAAPTKGTKSDWMELKSGEWLRGTFEGMYSGKVEFDSEEFDLVKFDTDDIKEIFTKGNSNINLNAPKIEINKLHKQLLADKQQISGNLSFKENHFIVTHEDGTTEIISANEIASISSGELKESNYWSADIFLGIDVLRGNTKQVTITGKASAERRTALTRFRADYLTTYTEVSKGEKTADNKRLTSSFDLYQTQHFYWRAASVEYVSDPFKNIDSKYTLGVGAGYDIIYTSSTDWSITTGPGYQYLEYSSVEVGENKSVSTALLFLDSRFKTEVTDDIDFIWNYHMYFVNKESGTYTHHMETTLETELVEDFKLNLSLFWDRIENPVIFADGTSPDKDDFKTMFSVGYSY